MLSVAGCAVNEAYNPVASGTSGTFELNAAALKQVSLKMTRAQVHQILGDSIVIGYNYQPQGGESKLGHDAPVPLTLKNPYKISEAKDEGGCVIEYYVTQVVIPDGIVSDQELMPLKFCKDILTAKGWDQIK